MNTHTHIYINIYVYIKYVSMYDATCTHVFRAEYLVLDSQRVYYFLGKTISPNSAFQLSPEKYFCNMNISFTVAVVQSPHTACPRCFRVITEKISFHLRKWKAPSSLRHYTVCLLCSLWHWETECQNLYSIHWNSCGTLQPNPLVLSTHEGDRTIRMRGTPSFQNCTPISLNLLKQQNLSLVSYWYCDLKKELWPRLKTVSKWNVPLEPFPAQVMLHLASSRLDNLWTLTKNNIITDGCIS